MKKSVKVFFMKAKYMLPSILVSFFILITTAIFFGTDNAVLGILLLFFNLMSMSKTFSVGSYIKDSIIFVVIGIIAAFAGLNFYTSMIINFIMPFFIIMLFSDELSPKRYFIYGLFFVLLQTVFPTTLAIIPSRIAATVYGLLVLFIFNIIQGKLRKKDNYVEMIKSGFNIISERVSALAGNKLNPKEESKISGITNKLSELLYNDVGGKAGLLNNKENKYFGFIVFLEGIDKLISEMATKDRFNENDILFLEKFSKILNNMAENYNIENNEKYINKLLKFVKNYSLTCEEEDYDWKYLISKLMKLLKPVKVNRITLLIDLRDGIRLKLIKFKRSFNLKSSHFRFAIRVSIVVCAGFTIAHLIPFPNSYWLPITAFTTMLPFYDDEKEKLSSNFIGLILGSICFILIFQFVPSQLGMIFMFLAFVFLFCLNSNVLRTIIGTQLALVMTSTMVADKFELIDMRILLVVLALVITWVTDKFVLHTDNYDGLLNRIDDMFYKDRMILRELRKALMKNKNSVYLDELLLETWLVKAEIETSAKKVDKIENMDDIYKLIYYNRNFILEAEKLINLFNFKEINQEDKIHISNTLDEMEKTIIRLQNIEDASLVYNLKRNRKEEKDDQYTDEYVKRSLLNCKNNMEKIGENSLQIKSSNIQ